jgi:hypothetical protein
MVHGIKAETNERFSVGSTPLTRIEYCLVQERLLLRKRLGCADEPAPEFGNEPLSRESKRQYYPQTDYESEKMACDQRIATSTDRTAEAASG